MGKNMRGKRAAVVFFVLLVGAAVFWALKYYWAPNPWVQATGTIEGTTVELTAKLGGTLGGMLVEEGEEVKKGQLVAEIDRPDLVAQRERDRLAVEKAEAQLNNMLAGARVEELNQARAQLEAERASLEKLKGDYERKKALYDQEAVSLDELEKIRTAVTVQENMVKAAEARLKLLEAGSRSQEIEAMRLEVERNRAVLNSTEAMLSDLKIYAPISGVIQSRNYEPGEYVPQGASVATLVDIDHLWIKVYIPSDELPRIRLGQEVLCTVSGYQKGFKGKVVSIASRGEFTPKTIQTKQERANVVFGVKIELEGGPGVLKPGMPADVKFLE